MIQRQTYMQTIQRHLTSIAGQLEIASTRDTGANLMQTIQHRLTSIAGQLEIAATLDSTSTTSNSFTS
jgi:hypothetical protein